MSELSSTPDAERFNEMVRAIEYVNSLPDDSRYHDFLSKNLLDETVRWELKAEHPTPIEPSGDSMILSGYLGTHITVIESAVISSLTSGGNTTLEGSLVINGNPYSVSRNEDPSYHNMVGNHLELGDNRLNAVLLSVAGYYVDEKEQAIEEMMDAYSDAQTSQEKLNATLLSLGSIVGQSSATTRAGVFDYNDKVLIARLTETETPYESSRSNEIESATFTSINQTTVENGIRVSNNNLLPNITEIGARGVSDFDMPLFSIKALERKTILERKGEVSYYNAANGHAEARAYASLCQEFIDLYRQLQHSADPTNPGA